MTDKEVGELWRLAHTKDAVFSGWWRNHAVDLIRKLVEERRITYLSWYSLGAQTRPDVQAAALEHALSYYGIDKESWKLAK